MGGYVYLICDPSNDSFKIGVTRDINNDRLKKLQTGNSTELHIVSIYKCNYPFRLETMLHKRFINKRILNEWFELSNDEVINFINICKEMDNVIHIMLENPFFNKNLK
jgi:hypothetical protein